MTRATRTARALLDRLRPLAIVELAAVTGGGETASTSNSGSPEAGDDTVGDANVRGGGPFIRVFDGQP